MGTNCAPLVADLFLFCYERDFMWSLSDNNQTDISDTSLIARRWVRLRQVQLSNGIVLSTIYDKQDMFNLK